MLTMRCAVTEAVTTVQSFQDVRTATETILGTVPKLVDLTRSTIEVAESIPDAKYFVELILTGKLTKVTDILESIKIITEFPKLVGQLQTAISSIVDFINKYGDGSESATALLDEVFSPAWETELLDPAANISAELRDAVLEIQEVVRLDVQEPFRNVTGAIRALEDVLDTLPFKRGRLSVKSDVSSYRRWSTVSMDMPCTRQKRAHFEVAGFKGSFDYPEFYACLYGPKEVPWPNHHIPYIKFRFD